MNKQEKPSYLKYAKELLNKFVDPIIDGIRHDDYNTYPIEIVFPTKKLEKTKDEYYDIFRIYVNGYITDLYSACSDDYFTLYLPKDKEYNFGMAFCFYHDDSQANAYEDDTWERHFVYKMDCAFGKDNYDTCYSRDGGNFVLSKFPEPVIFDDISEIVAVLRQLMVKRYAKVTGVDIFTEEQFNMLQANKLNQELEKFCKTYGISKDELH